MTLDVSADVVEGPFVRHVVRDVEGVPQCEAEEDADASIAAGGGRHRAIDGIRGAGAGVGYLPAPRSPLASQCG